MLVPTDVGCGRGLFYRFLGVGVVQSVCVLQACCCAVFVGMQTWLVFMLAIVALLCVRGCGCFVV